MKISTLIKRIIYLTIVMISLSACLPQLVNDTTEISPTATEPNPVPDILLPEKSITDESIKNEIREPIRIQEADRAFVFGDYESAESLYTSVIEQSEDIESKVAASFGLAMTFTKREDGALALSAFNQIIRENPESVEAIRSYLKIAEIYRELARNQEAIDAYQTFLDKRPGVIEAYVNEQIGDLFFAEANYPDALAAFQAAFLSQSTWDEELAIKIGRTYEIIGEQDIALNLYQDIYFNSTSFLTKAQMDLLMGRIYYNTGDKEKAYSYYQDAVNNYPLTYDSYSALVVLVEDGQPVNELQRGKINSFIGQYDLAIQAYDRYLSTTQVDIPEGLYYKGIALRDMGIERAGFSSNERFEANSKSGTEEDLAAIASWEEILLYHPTSDFYSLAFEEIATTYYSYMNNPEKAAQTLLDLVATIPDSDSASDWLFNAGRYYEIAGLLSNAADTWFRLGNEYPNSSTTFQGLFFAGMIYYKLGEYEKATLAFNRGLVLSYYPLESAGAQLWLGIVQSKLGNIEAAKDFWRSAKLSDPNGYYGLRAEELINGGTFNFTTPNLNFEVDWENERVNAKIWLQNTFNLPSNNESEILALIKQDPAYLQGIEFWSLGMFSEGREMFAQVVEKNVFDPRALFEFIPVLMETGYFRLVIDSSRQIIKLAGYNEYDEDIPIYFKHLIYGPYYAEWIIPAAQKYQIDPILLMSLIHQESHFEGYLSSGAGALGLMQIMPETGSQIAGEIRWPENFDKEDLDIPYIGLIIGTNYLARQINAFDGDIYSALAAYNGGPGNTIKWKAASGDDPDLFLGSIRYLETRTYLRVIVENYYQYQNLYSNEN